MDDPELGFSLYMDNDLFYPPTNDDRNYTMGLGLQISGEWVDRTNLTWPLRFIDRMLRVESRRGGRRNFHSVIFGGSGYTPDDLEDSNPIFNDRPYASLIYFSTSILSVGDKNDWAFTTELTLGLLGLDVAENLQTFIHQNVSDSAIPKGWKHQISDGGEMSVLYRLRLEKQFLDYANISMGDWDLLQTSVGLDLGLGYYTYARGGPMIRIGYIKTPFWGFEPNPLGPNTKRQTTDLSDSAGAGGRLKLIKEAFLFAGFSGILVGYNALLQGQFRNSDVTFSNSEIERFLYDMSAGFGMTLGPINLSYAIAARSDEFQGTRGRDHIWGGFYLTVTKNF